MFQTPMPTTRQTLLASSLLQSQLLRNFNWGLIPVIGLAVPEIASTDSHDTCPACVREGPTPGGPTLVYKLLESRVLSKFDFAARRVV